MAQVKQGIDPGGEGQHDWDKNPRTNAPGLKGPVRSQLTASILHPEHLECVGTASSGWLALFFKLTVTQDIKEYASQISYWRDRKQKPECFT